MKGFNASRSFACPSQPKPKTKAWVGGTVGRQVRGTGGQKVDPKVQDVSMDQGMAGNSKPDTLDNKSQLTTKSGVHVS